MRTNTERAEERLDRIGDQLKRFFSDGAKPFVLKTVGRIREEAEDIVAEAKNVRGRSPSDAPPA
jgi:hypothetical protein